MPKITKIEPQKRKGRFNIYLDDKFFTGISEDVIVGLGLQEGLEIDLKQIKKFQKREEETRVYTSALRFLSFRLRSEKEMIIKLSKKFPKVLVDKTIKRLKKEKLLNDEEFARAWVRDRMVLRSSGRRLIFQELILKGVSKELIKEIIEKEYNQDRELELAKKIAKGKFKTYKNLPRREYYQKMVGFLARHGYSWETIKKVLEGQ